MKAFIKFINQLIAVPSILLSTASLACIDVEPDTNFGENIVTHGAVANDNIDDSAAISCAIEAAIQSSGKIFIPAGIFTLEKSIFLIDKKYDNLAIQGLGRKSRLEHKKGDFAFAVGTLKNKHRNPEHVTFKDFEIVSLNNPQASAGIIYNNANRAYIENLRIHGYNSRTSGQDKEGGAGIKYRNTWIHTVRNTYITNSTHGVHAKGKGVVNALNIENNVIENITHGITLGRVVVVNIKDNTIEGHAMQNGVHCEFACRSITIAGNYFEAPDATQSERAVFIGNESSNAAITIQGNFAYMGGSNSVIEIRNVRGSSISGNMFTLDNFSGADFIRIGGNGLATQNISIHSNHTAEMGNQSRSLTKSSVRYIRSDTGKIMDREYKMD